MRIVFAVLIGLMAGSVFNSAKADPYKWCAITGGGDDGGTVSCYFVTLEQCRTTVSGVGGFCRVNLWYDGRPEGANVSVAKPKKQPAQPHG